MFIIDDLLFSPVNGLFFVVKKIHEMVEQELNDETVIKQQLLELQMQLELEEISEEEYSEREAEVFARLRSIKERQLEVMQQPHTAESSSMIIETSVADDTDSHAPNTSTAR